MSKTSVGKYLRQLFHDAYVKHKNHRVFGMYTFFKPNLPDFTLIKLLLTLSNLFEYIYLIIFRFKICLYADKDCDFESYFEIQIQSSSPNSNAIRVRGRMRRTHGQR
ncbi:hypothetical protein X777_00750 [Ooceraea biroi]|uniref:Uncharacterized protein n=1 Tax=Ooceraea biroi TaxID=2015173 RepID=A0A026WNS0_OOCBI|nr:hypothetical protein X777_00750 [Ooceraea biroi]